MRKSGKKTPKGSRRKKAAVNDLWGEERQGRKGRTVDIFAKLGDIEGESRY